MNTEKGDLSDAIIFLGTAGARVMVTNQITASGGAWLKLGKTEILLDPGPGSLVQALKRKLDPAKLQAIILSHKHIDHSNDINIMIEAMTESGRRKRGLVFAPSDALEVDPVILRYLRNFPQEFRILSEGQSYAVDDVTFRTPLRHVHPVETYGFVFETPRCKFSWIVDTRYSDDLARHYEGEVIILNIVRLEPGLPIDHLSVPEAAKIIEKIKPRTAIMTHYGMTVWRARPWEIARRLSEETGINVIAAHDGMQFEF